MLLLVSDLHFTDGTSGSTIRPGAFHILAERLRDMAVRASWRTDGRYRPIERIDVVLLGDILDLIRSSRWLAGRVRPWDDPHSPEMIDTVTQIVHDVLLHNEPSMQILRSLSSEDGLCIPAAAPDGQFVRTTGQRPVAVQVYYMVGNCDWMLHLPGPAYDRLRKHVIQHIGLANRHDAPFPHDPLEDDPLLNVLRTHRVLARHGDLYDPLNCEEDRDGASLGDAIVIELLGRFAVETQRLLGDELPAPVRAGFREIDNIRPLLIVPAWIDGLLERACPSRAVRKKIKRIWDSLADDLLSLPFVRERDRCRPMDWVDHLEKVLKFSKRLSIGKAGKITARLDRVRDASGRSYHEHALAEPDFRNRRARHIVFGHTHHAESVALDASFAEGYVLNQMYFNTGTWRRVFRATRLAPGACEFIPSECMTYAAFFRKDERGGRSFETWSGMLGADAGELAVPRADPPQPSQVPKQQIQAFKEPLWGPHFGASSRPAETRSDAQK